MKITRVEALHVRPSMRFADGELRLAESPGLGVELSEEILRQFIVH